jgi:hypothetical protein
LNQGEFLAHSLHLLPIIKKLFSYDMKNELKQKFRF